MDTSILKLLEDDEDESMHDVADVEALTAALNRDIATTDELISSDQEAATAGNDSVSSQLHAITQSSDVEIITTQQSDQRVETLPSCYMEQGSFQIEQMSEQSSSLGMHLESDIQSEKRLVHSKQELSETIYHDQQLCESENNKVPKLHPDKDKAIQLGTAYSKLPSNQKYRENFSIVINPAKSGSPAKKEKIVIQPSRFPPCMSNMGAASLMDGSVASIPKTAMACDTFGTPEAASGTNAKPTQKKASVGQKRLLNSQGTPPASSKKQKVAETFPDQSIKQLSDVTAVSGVNIREEEEQLLAVPREETTSQVTQRAVQEQNEKLILHKIPLQKKIAEIISKSGIQDAGSDVGRCLSMCVEERLRGIVSGLIRVSKKRMDVEKAHHQFIITSDISKEILAINKKAKEDWEEKQPLASVKLWQSNEPGDGYNKVDAEKEKDEARPKVRKQNKEEDDRMRTTTANMAVRVAVGGDDMPLKWQLMSEKARQKCGAGFNDASGSPTGKLSSHNVVHNTGKSSKDAQDGNKNGAASKGRRNANLHAQVYSITLQDIISVLEKEHKLSKSPLLWRLYDRIWRNSVTQ